MQNRVLFYIDIQAKNIDNDIDISIFDIVVDSITAFQLINRPTTQKVSQNYSKRLKQQNFMRFDSFLRHRSYQSRPFTQLFSKKSEEGYENLSLPRTSPV
jgi:hypothetical protein